MTNDIYCPTLLALPNVKIAAVCDRHPDRLAHIAMRFHVERTYDDYQKMIDEIAPDAVFAIGQPHSMYGIWTWCLERGIHLFVEKPLGLTLHQARTLAYLAELHHCITQVCFQRRSSPLLQKLLMECRAHGHINYAAVSFLKYSPEPFIGPFGHMLNDGIHAIDTLRHICRGEVIHLHCMTKRIGAPDINFIAAQLEFDSGASGQICCNWTAGHRLFHVKMDSLSISAEADLEGIGYLYGGATDTPRREFDARQIAGSTDKVVFCGFQAKIRQFLDCVHSGGIPESNFTDALKTHVIAERILSMDLLRQS